jgi:hypothetical protein
MPITRSMRRASCPPIALLVARAFYGAALRTRPHGRTSFGGKHCFCIQYDAGAVHLRGRWVDLYAAQQPTHTGVRPKATGLEGEGGRRSPVERCARASAAAMRHAPSIPYQVMVMRRLAGW